jgi:hypothetical protein
MFHRDCQKCVTASLGLREWYEWTYNDGMVLAWDVTAAWEMVGDRALRFERREPGVTFEFTPLPPEVASVLLEQDAVLMTHVGHVDPSYPGLVVMVPDEQAGEAAILIDGAHRCVRASFIGREFTAVLLTREEDEACRISAADLEQLRRPSPFGVPTLFMRGGRTT